MAGELITNAQAQRLYRAINAHTQAKAKYESSGTTESELVAALGHLQSLMTEYGYGRRERLGKNYAVHREYIKHFDNHLYDGGWHPSLGPVPNDSIMEIAEPF